MRGISPLMRELSACIAGALARPLLIDAVWNIEKLGNVRDLRPLLRA